MAASSIAGTRSIRRRAAFTIVELLVATAIIAVLVSILLPVLSHARERARDIQCRSLMKAMHLASVTYANDFNAVPAGRSFENHLSAPQPSPVSPNWYMSTLRPWTTGPAFGIVNMNRGYLEKSKVSLWCPSKDATETASQTFFWGRKIDEPPWGLSGSPYAASGHRFSSIGNDPNGWQYLSGGAIPLKKWDRFIKAYYITEVVGGHIVATSGNLDPGSHPRAARHLGSVNVLFPGGHVVQMPQAEIKSLIDSGDREFLWGD